MQREEFGNMYIPCYEVPEAMKNALFSFFFRWPLDHRKNVRIPG